MKSIERRSSRTIFALFFLAQLGLPLLSIGFFVRRFDYPAETIIYHEFLVATGYFVLLGLAMLLTRFRALQNRSAAGYVLPLLWGGFTVALYFAHLFAWVGHVGLGMNLTPSMIKPYVLHPSTLFSTTPISPVVFWGALVVIPSVLLLAYAVAARSLSSAPLRLWARVDILRGPSNPV